MQLKKFKVKTIREAMEKIKIELGEDAFIISDRQINENGEKFIEVIAAVEKDSAPSTFRASPSNINIPDTKEKTGVKELKELIEKLDYRESEILPIKKEIEELKKIISEKFSTSKRAIEFEGVFYDVFTRLLEEGIAGDVASKLVKVLEYQVPLKFQNDIEKIKAYLWKIVFSSISDIKLIDSNKDKIIALIGPTGVGKTTTIAKLSAYFYLAQQKKVALISIDSYRIAAPEQLKTYASLIGIPFALAYNREELDKYIRMFNDYDLIFIDTVGKRISEESVKRDSEILGKERIKKLLVLSATTKSEDLVDVVKKYKIMGPQSIIFTKMDETLSFGNIFNTLVKEGLPLSYFTTGQKVPQDIEVASPEKLTNLLLRRVKNGSGRNS